MIFDTERKLCREDRKMLFNSLVLAIFFPIIFEEQFAIAFQRPRIRWGFILFLEMNFDESGVAFSMNRG